MTRALLAAAALNLILAAPVSATCLDEIEGIEQQIHDGQATSQDQESTSVKTGDGQLMLEGQDGGVEPQENWFGSPDPIENAAEQLENARRLADAGDEAGCMAEVEHARQIAGDLQP